MAEKYVKLSDVKRMLGNARLVYDGFSIGYKMHDVNLDTLPTVDSETVEAVEKVAEAEKYKNILEKLEKMLKLEAKRCKVMQEVCPIEEVAKRYELLALENETILTVIKNEDNIDSLIKILTREV